MDECESIIRDAESVDDMEGSTVGEEAGDRDINTYADVEGVFQFLRQHKKLIQMENKTMSSTRTGNSTPSKAKDVLKDFWKKGIATVKQMSGKARDECEITKIASTCLSVKSLVSLDNYILLDPKTKASIGRSSQSTRFSKFSSAIMFMIGSGNIVEYQNLCEFAEKEGKSVLYGTTDMNRPADFLKELRALGKQN